VEDDRPTARSLSRILETSGYRVCTAENAADASELLRDFRPQLIVLDLMLPDADGLLVLPSLRAITSAPIIICSARRRQVDRVLGLKLGADDYLAKPFDLEELEARVEAVLRRATRSENAAAGTPARIEVGDLVISPARATVTIGGVRVHLTPTEFRLLLTLANHTGTVLSREALGQDVWGYADVGTHHLIDVHVGRLRLKLRRGLSVSSPVVETVRGRGYRLACDTSSAED
jgi:DNA-binding response OmpR family regulator